MILAADRTPITSTPAAVIAGNLLGTLLIFSS